MFGIGITEIIVVLIFIIFIFLICREIVCWYWKINIRVKQNAQILERLNYLARKEGFKPKLEQVAEKPSIPNKLKQKEKVTKNSKPLKKLDWKTLNKRRIVIYVLLVIALIAVAILIILLRINPYLPSLGRYMFPHILD